ncbi:hypothetical protein [Streptomyces sp. NPDC003032]
MRWNDICIAGLGIRLPPPEPAVDMAAVAGRQAMARSGPADRGGGVARVLATHSSSEPFFEGLDRDTDWSGPYAEILRVAE